MQSKKQVSEVKILREINKKLQKQEKGIIAPKQLAEEKAEQAKENQAEVEKPPEETKTEETPILTTHAFMDRNLADA